MTGVSCCCVTGDLWTVVYSPDNGSEVMGNNGVVKSMHQWLVDWKCVLLGAPVTTSKSNVSVPKYRAACMLLSLLLSYYF